MVLDRGAQRIRIADSVKAGSWADVGLVGRSRLTGRSAGDQEVRPTLGAGAFGFLDEFAEFGEPGFVDGEQAAIVFEVFEDGEGAREVAEFVVGEEEVALEIGAAGFGLGEAFGDGERFLEVGLG